MEKMTRFFLVLFFLLSCLALYYVDASLGWENPEIFPMIYSYAAALCSCVLATRGAGSVVMRVTTAIFVSLTFSIASMLTIYQFRFVVFERIHPAETQIYFMLFGMLVAGPQLVLSAFFGALANWRSDAQRVSS